MTDARPSPKSPLWMRITLFVSLAFNLLMIGAVAGVVMTGGLDARADRSDRDVGRVFTRALSLEDRRALRRDFMRGLAAQEGGRGAIVADLQETLQLLRSTPFDADGFKRVMARQSERRDVRDEVGRTALAERISQMSDAERAAYADRLEAGFAGLSKTPHPRP